MPLKMACVHEAAKQVQYTLSVYNDAALFRNATSSSASPAPSPNVMALASQGSLSSPSRAQVRSRCPDPTADNETLLLFSSPNAQARHPSRRLLLFSSPKTQTGRPLRGTVDPA